MGLPQIGLEAVLRDENFQNGLKRYQQGIGQMEKSTEHAAGVLNRIGGILQGAVVAGLGAATVAVGAFAAASKVGLDATLQWSEGLDSLGDQFGMTGEQGSTFQFLANKVGVSVDEMGFGLRSITNGLQGVEDRLKSGSKTLSPFEQGLSKIGLSAFNSRGKLKTFDELLPDLMDAFNKLPPGIKASSVAMDLFGARGGSKFLDFLRQGSSGLEDARKKAKALGLELSTDEVNAAEEFGFAMNELNLGIKGFWNQIGRQVLPVVRRFVDLLNTRMVPVLSNLARNIAPLIGRALNMVSDALENILTGFGGDWNPFIRFLDAAFGRTAANAVGQFILAAGGVADAIRKIFDAFKTGGLAGGLQAIGTQLTNAFKNVDWAAVSRNLDSLKTQFWTWLTGKGGVLEQVGAELKKVVAAIGGWLSNPSNTQPIVDAILGKNGLVAQFWAFVTDPNAGLIATVSVKMGELVKTIKEWSELPETKKKFQEVGKTIANTILDGIGSVFTNPGEGRNLLVDLRNTINDAYQNLKQTFANIGTDIAHGVVEGIVGWFGSSDAAARIASAFDPLFNAVFNILATPGGLIGVLAQRIVQAISTALSQGLAAGIQSLNPLGGGTSTPSAPSTPTTRRTNWVGVTGFAEGGWVGRTGPALVHAGEYVLNRQQAMAWAPMLTRPNVTSNSFTFSHTWNGAPASFDRRDVERIAENAAYRGLSRVLPGR